MKIDGRVQYTRMVIRENFMILLKNKSIKQITVKEICELSGINRATFYAHYQNAYDLLENIENELFSEITTAVGSKTENIDNLINEIFAVVEKNIDLCNILFSDNGNRMFLQRLMQIARAQSIIDWKNQYPNATFVQLEYMYEFIAGGAVSVISHWVNTGMKETPRQFGEIINGINNTWLTTLS